MIAYALDVETAFLHGKLEEEIFMNVPEGYSEDPDFIKTKAMRLKKAIHGLVQAARQWWKKFNSEILKLGFKGNNIDPCLYFKKEDGKKCIVTLYIDDSIIAGDENLIEETVKGLKNTFEVKVQGGLKDYLGCEISKTNEGFLIGQERIVQDLIVKFGDYLSGKDCSSPSANREVIHRKIENYFDKERQKLYQSGVRSLLYLVKHSRPDLSNCVQELSKVMDQANIKYWNSLIRAIKYVKETKEYIIKIINSKRKEDECVLEVFSHSDYSVDKETRQSVTGYVIFLDVSPILWRSRGQKSVTLSTTEAEYAAMSEAVREVKFIYQVLQTMNFQVSLPIKVNVDNIGASFLAENKNTSERTKHVDVRYHFVREMMDENFLNVKFVPTDQNIADIFTKNLDNKKFEYFQKKLGIEAKNKKQEGYRIMN
jgi:hypothetical protein